ncbi:hypothetical protein F5B22DRAFT_248514 [Xylaria bambusicola]|uniref:uncharacterized protein n=1 Tax=Xylaria bambusicola TaxID=326684 RepID=UPI00200829EC|nr:uncharacterized protein F5B22DRAFT_248514 [Xylaria bambusicola]KAI0513323.1 hypothetical protein F5B22DRAFT_248514 [Xylaria bambusicola]
MIRPSEHWQGFADIDSGSDKYRRIELLLSSANFEYLKTRAIESRRKHQPDLNDDVGCSVDLTHFTSGFNNLVLELAFSDNTFWIARIPHQPFNDSDETSTLSEIATMRLIKRHTNIPIPQIFDFGMSTQSFGYPFIFMDYLGGRTLSNGLAVTIPHQHRNKVANQLANVLAELQNMTFSRIGRIWCGDDANQPIEIIPMAWHASPGPLDTSLEYFYNQ